MPTTCEAAETRGTSEIGFGESAGSGIYGAMYTFWCWGGEVRLSREPTMPRADARVLSYRGTERALLQIEFAIL